MGRTNRPPKWIKPQLTRLVDEAPSGKDWLHEIKYDGYRMHAQLADGKAQLLTRTGLDWSPRYERTIETLHSLQVKSAYLDGELCALNADGAPVFSRLSANGRHCFGSRFAEIQFRAVDKQASISWLDGPMGQRN